MTLNNIDKKVLVFSHKQFDSLCEAQEWSDDNIDTNEEVAFISLIGTKECRTYWMDENNDHWFKQNHSNVLNLEFDDLFSDKEHDGHIFKAMTFEQAIESVDFIENNLGKHFIIHCHAGVSRSQAYFRFITDHYTQIYKSDCGRKENPCNSPNMAVTMLLDKAYRLKHNLNASSFGEIEKDN